MNYLITGGYGFVGSYLANKLSNQKDNKVYIIDNLSNKNQNLVSKKVKKFYGNVSDFTFLEKIVTTKKIDYIYHLSATINESIFKEDVYNDISTSIISTVNFLEIIKKYKIKKFIFVSSIAVYGKAKIEKFDENSITKPEFSYGISKRCAEDYVEYYRKKFKLNCSVIRVGNIYGPYQPKIGEVGVINIFIKNALNKKLIKIFGTGNQSRDFIFIDDVVNFLIKCKSIKNNLYNLVSGNSIKIISLAKLIKIITKSQSNIKFFKERLEEVGHFRASSNLAKKNKLKISFNIEKGIRKTVQFYEKNKQFL
jgi:UDP-glucose 4-epimerase